jgi:hypothetical protein
LDTWNCGKHHRTLLPGCALKSASFFWGVHWQEWGDINDLWIFMEISPTIKWWFFYDGISWEILIRNMGLT